MNEDIKAFLILFFGFGSIVFLVPLYINHKVKKTKDLLDEIKSINERNKK